METSDWDELLDDDAACFNRDACIGELLRESPDNCLYCRLGGLIDGDDD